MGDEHVVHGKPLRAPVSSDSVGIQILNAFRDSEEHPLLIDAATGKHVTNKELLYRSCRLGQALRNYGLNKNYKIGICSENNLNYLDSVLAALYSGISVVTISSQYTEGELANAINLAQPSIVFSSVQASIGLCKAKHQFLVVPKIIIINQKEDHKEFQSVENFILNNIPENYDVNDFEAFPVDIKNDVAFVLFSSGTTGLPKGVMITHLNVNTVFAIFHDVGLSTYSAVTFLPLHHAYGLFSILSRIVLNIKVVIMNKFDPHLYLTVVQEYKIDTLHLVPSVAQFFSKHDVINKFDLSCVKDVICGGAPLSKDIEQNLAKRLNINNVRQGYGMTESTVGMISQNFNIKEYPIGSCGHVLPGLSVKIIDVNTGKSLGPMNSGEICCRGNVIMKGYLNNPEATKIAIDKDGWLHTGDVAYYDYNNCFFIVDRIKELIKCKAHQVAPAELEALLLNHPKILDAGVIGVANERYGEVPLAFVVKAQNQKLSEKEVKDFVAGKVANYKQLRGGVKFVPQIPRNASGKILRRLLRRELKSHL